MSVRNSLFLLITVLLALIFALLSGIFPFNYLEFSIIAAISIYVGWQRKIAIFFSVILVIASAYFGSGNAAVHVIALAVGGLISGVLANSFLLGKTRPYWGIKLIWLTVSVAIVLFGSPLVDILLALIINILIMILQTLFIEQSLLAEQSMDISI